MPLQGNSSNVQDGNRKTIIPKEKKSFSKTKGLEVATLFISGVLCFPLPKEGGSNDVDLSATFTLSSVKAVESSA